MKKLWVSLLAMLLTFALLIGAWAEVVVEETDATEIEEYEWEEVPEEVEEFTIGDESLVNEEILEGEEASAFTESEEYADFVWDGAEEEVVIATKPAMGIVQTTDNYTEYTNDTTFSVNDGKTIKASDVGNQNNCWTYASNIYSKIWGVGFNSTFSDSNMLRNLSDNDRRLTADNLKKYVSAAELGSSLRITGCTSSCSQWGNDGLSCGHSGHSLIIIDKDSNGLTVLDNHRADGQNYSVKTRYYSWQGFVNYWSKYPYIKYIKWPNASEYSGQSNIQYSVFDINGWIGNNETGDLNKCGTIDIYMNGSIVADDVSDYCQSWPVGTTYEIKDIKAKKGFAYKGVYSGSLSGTIGTSAYKVILLFESTTFTVDGFVVEDGVLKNYTGKGGDITIPDGVTEIGSFFCQHETNNFDEKYNNTITAVTIPASVKKIDSNAFCQCIALKNVYFSEGLIEIEICAFKWCAVETINLPESLLVLGDMAFQGCSYLRTVKMPNKMKSYGVDDIHASWSDSGVFAGCEKLKSIDLPNTVGCKDGIDYIPYGLLRGCESIITLEIPNGTRKICDKAFVDSGIQTIYIPESVSYIAEEAFGPSNAATRNVTIYCNSGSAAEAYAVKNGIKYQLTDVAHTHSTVTVLGKAATCTATGLTDGTKCSVCGEWITPQQTIAKTAHKPVTVKGKAATCTAAGLTDGSQCSVCKAWITPQKTIAATGHKAVTVKGKAATCTAAGLTDGSQCCVCKAWITPQKTIAARGHKPMTVKGKAATCTTTGLTDGTKCSACGTWIKAQQTIAKKAHTPTTVKGYAATYVGAGLSDGSKCSACGATLKAQTTIARKTLSRQCAGEEGQERHDHGEHRRGVLPDACVRHLRGIDREGLQVLQGQGRIGGQGHRPGEAPEGGQGEDHRYHQQQEEKGDRDHQGGRPDQADGYQHNQRQDGDDQGGPDAEAGHGAEAVHSEI